MKTPLFSLLFFIVMLSYGQINEFVTLRVDRVFTAPLSSTGVMVSKAQYSNAQSVLQKKINRTIAESVVTYAPLSDTLQWTNFDREEITPYTWKWVHLHVDHIHGGKSKITLRRPVWWLKAHQIDSVGATVSLSIAEFGINGVAQVLAVYASQVDTRFWNEARSGDFACRPIIGNTNTPAIMSLNSP